ncbi:PAS domain S-box protein [Pyxidicoccus sp. 3LG]
MEPMEAGHGATSIAVLLIEEQPARLLELEQALAPLCVRLVRAASDESALQATEREDFALVLVGLQRDGFELVRRLRARERTRHTPVLVFLRGDADAARLPARSGPWDTVDLMCEPVDPGALRSRVAALVELHARSERLQGLLDDAAGERSRLLHLLRLVPAAISITRGPDFVFEFANPAYEQLVGRRIVPGQTLRELFPEVLPQPEVMAVLDRVMATGEVFVGREFKVDIDRRGDGVCEEAFFDVVHQPLRVDGRVEALLTHAVDVTSQVRARKAAEAAEAKARFLAEAGERLAVSLDVDAVLGEVARLAVPGIADWSSVDLLTEDGRVDRLVVVSREDARVRASREALRRWPHDVRSGPSPVSQVLRTGEPLLVPEVSEADFASWSTTPEHLALVRVVGLCSLLCVPLKARGRVLGALTLAQAESGRRFSEEDTRLVMELARRASLSLDNALLYREAWRAQERYRSFIQATSRMAWTADPWGNIVEDSPSWRAFTGQTEAEYLGRGWLDAVHPEDRARVDEAWSRATTSTRQGAYETEYRVRRPDGTYTPTMARGAPVFAPDGTLREWVGANEDLTAKKAAEAERERLAATVAMERERSPGSWSSSPSA